MLGFGLSSRIQPLHLFKWFHGHTTLPLASVRRYAEAFHLGTVGGAEVLGLEAVCGNFAPGKQLDALVVDCGAGVIDLFGRETTLEKFEKFLFLGDDRNIAQVWVDGTKR